MSDNEIEFNNGFITALVLFQRHIGQINQPENFPDSRINGACDHLYDIEIPEQLKETPIQNEIKTFIQKAFDTKKLYWKVKRTPTDIENYKQQVENIFEEGLQILIKIDKQIFQLKTVEVKYP